MAKKFSDEFSSKINRHHSIFCLSNLRRHYNARYNTHSTLTHSTIHCHTITPLYIAVYRSTSLYFAVLCCTPLCPIHFWRCFMAYFSTLLHTPYTSAHSVHPVHLCTQCNKKGCYKTYDFHIASCRLVYPCLIMVHSLFFPHICILALGSDVCKK